MSFTTSAPEFDRRPRDARLVSVDADDCRRAAVASDRGSRAAPAVALLLPTRFQRRALMQAIPLYGIAGLAPAEAATAAPGRVDSPPTSMMVAPSSSNCSA